MKKDQIISLTETLNVKLDIFICGPSYGDSNKKTPNTKLRVYTCGGLLCELPTESRAEIKLLDKKYLPKNSPLFMSLHGLRGNEKKEKFLRDHLNALLLFMENRFTSKKGGAEERHQQTVISRAHSNFGQHHGTVVCDFQSSIPKAWLPDGLNRPDFDIVTFSMDETGGGIFTLIELKCNKAACDKGSGLKKHAKDMLECVQSHSTKERYKEELLRRLGYMREYGLLQNCPDELEHLRPEDVDLRAAFLFIHGKGLQSHEKAAVLCREYIPEADLGEFSYCFAESPEAVDLSHMENWEAFSSNK